MITNYLNDVQFKTTPKSYSSGNPYGLRYPNIICDIGTTGDGKSYELSQYCKDSVKHNDYDRVFALCSEFRANAQYFNHIDKLTSIFPEEHIDDVEKVSAWLDNVADQNRPRMIDWKAERLKYNDNYSSFIQNANLQNFINIREAPFKDIDLNLVVKPLMKKQRVKDKTKNHSRNEESKTYTTQTTRNLDKFLLDDTDLYQLYKDKQNTISKDLPSASIDMKKVELYWNKPPCVVIFADDLLGTDVMLTSKKNKLTKKVISLRHDGISFLFGIQALTGGLPRNIRINTKVFIIHFTNDETMIKQFYLETCSNLCSFKDFKLFFNNVIDGKTHKFLLIDRIERPLQMRINWNIISNAQEMINYWLKLLKPINSQKRKRTET